MKIIFFAFLIFASSSVFAQSANQSANSSQSNDYMMGGISAAAGGTIIGIYAPQLAGCPLSPTCPMAQMMTFVVGPSLIAEGIADIMQGNKSQGAIDGTVAGGVPTIGDVGDGLGLGPNVPTPVTNALQTALGTAAANGINPTTQAGLDSAASNAGMSGGGADAAQQALSSLSPDQLAQVKAIEAKVASGFSVSSVGTEGGGGGGGINKGNKTGDDGLAKMFAALNGAGGGDRGPASVEGLSKNFNGDAIGLAGDDIFKIVTRRYQSKIAARTFLIDSAPIKHKFGK